MCDHQPISLLDREERLSAVSPTTVSQQPPPNIGPSLEAPVYFDVFLCHNSADKDEVKKIGQMLKDRNIRPWLDEWELRPGLPWQDLLEQQIAQIRSAAVFIGSQGVGPWQKQEIQALLREFVSRGCPVIPVLLSTAPTIPDLPLFLRGMGWVDFRKEDSDSLSKLLWGVTGERY